jgi:hypothetical protein
MLLRVMEGCEMDGCIRGFLYILPVSLIFWGIIYFLVRVFL